MSENVACRNLHVFRINKLLWNRFRVMFVTNCMSGWRLQAKQADVQGLKLLALTVLTGRRTTYKKLSLRDNFFRFVFNTCHKLTWPSWEEQALIGYLGVPPSTRATLRPLKVNNKNCKSTTIVSDSFFLLLTN